MVIVDVYSTNDAVTPSQVENKDAVGTAPPHAGTVRPARACLVAPLLGKSMIPTNLHCIIGLPSVMHSTLELPALHDMCMRIHLVC